MNRTLAVLTLRWCYRPLRRARGERGQQKRDEQKKKVTSSSRSVASSSRSAASPAPQRGAQPQRDQPQRGNRPIAVPALRRRIRSPSG
jgi:hypothetical protein